MVTVLLLFDKKVTDVNSDRLFRDLILVSSIRAKNIVCAKWIYQNVRYKGDNKKPESLQRRYMD